MTKSVGACRLAATVWPTSTSRDTTIPSMGAWIFVWARFTRPLELGPPLAERRLGGLLLHQGGVVGEAGDVELALRHHPVLLELEKAIELALLVAHGDLGLAQGRLGASQVGLGLGDLRLEQGGLDLGDQVAASGPGC